MLLSEILKNRNKNEADAIRAVEKFELEDAAFKEETAQSIGSLQKEIDELKTKLGEGGEA